MQCLFENTLWISILRELSSFDRDEQKRLADQRTKTTSQDLPGDENISELNQRKEK
jgi:hypothetical protein